MFSFYATFPGGMMNQDNSNVDVVCIPTLDQYNKIIPVVDTKTRGPVRITNLKII